MQRPVSRLLLRTDIPPPQLRIASPTFAATSAVSQEESATSSRWQALLKTTCRQTHGLKADQGTAEEMVFGRCSSSCGDESFPSSKRRRGMRIESWASRDRQLESDETLN